MSDLDAARQIVGVKWPWQKKEPDPEALPEEKWQFSRKEHERGFAPPPFEEHPQELKDFGRTGSPVELWSRSGRGVVYPLMDARHHPVFPPGSVEEGALGRKKVREAPAFPPGTKAEVRAVGPDSIMVVIRGAPEGAELPMWTPRKEPAPTLDTIWHFSKSDIWEPLPEGSRRKWALAPKTAAPKHIIWNGIPIDIEWSAGDVREFDDSDYQRYIVPPWSYGYIRNTEGEDGDALDCFVCPNEDADTVYICVQKAGAHEDAEGEADLGSFDEFDVIFGADDESEAEAVMRLHYDREQVGPVFAVPLEEFREMVLPVIGEKTAGKVYKMLRHYTIEELQEEYNKLSGVRRRTRDPAVLQEATDHLRDVNIELQHRLTTMQSERLIGEHETGETQSVRLKDIAQVGSPLRDADFWLQRRGSENTVGTLRDGKWAQYDIGVKMRPEYAHLLPLVRSRLYILHSQGYWRPYAYGTLALQHIRTNDARDIEIEIPAASTKTAATIIPEMGDVTAAIDMSKDMVMSADSWNEFVDALSPVRYALQTQNVWFHMNQEDEPSWQFPRRYILRGAAGYVAPPSGHNPYLRLTLGAWIPEDTSTISWPTMRAELIERIGHELIHTQQYLKSKGKSNPRMDQDYLSNPQEFSAKAWNIAQQLTAAWPKVLYEPFGQIPWQLSEEYKEEYERNYADAKFLKKLKRKVVDILQHLSDQQTEQTKQDWDEEDKKSAQLDEERYHAEIVETNSAGALSPISGTFEEVVEGVQGLSDRLGITHWIPAAGRDVLSAPMAHGNYELSFSGDGEMVSREELDRLFGAVARRDKTAAQITVDDQVGGETAIPFEQTEPGDRVRFLEPFEGVEEGAAGTVLEVRVGGPDMLVQAPARQELDDGRVVVHDTELVVPANCCSLLLHPDDERI